MNKLFSATLLAASVMTFGAANAQYTGPAAAKTTSTVSEAMAMPDESMVVLQGTIASSTGDEMYIFTDSTGNINVEIDDDDMKGMTVGPNDMVIIQGEIDKNGNMVEVDVDEIMLAQ